MAQQYFSSMVQKLPSACVLDIIAPTFSGVASVTPQANGSLLVGWLVASDIALPLTYEIYCLPGSVSAGVLFSSSPALASQNLSEYLFRDSAQALLVSGTYTVGVRVRDAVGNLDSNIATLGAVSAGVLTDSLAAIAASLAISDSSIAASAATLSGAIAGLPDPAVMYGVVEDEEVIATVDEPISVAIEFTGSGGGMVGDEVTIYPIITAPQNLAKQLTLPVVPLTASEVKVDWISVGPQVFGLDYTVTGSVLSWAGLGMDTNGLSENDQLRIVYQGQ